MFKAYRNIRVGLITLAFGLAAVYFASGLSIANSEIPVDVPLASTDVLYVKPENPPHMCCSIASCDELTEDEIREKVLEGRDLKMYEFGGNQGCGLTRDCTASKFERSIRRANNFIWEHWKQKRRGYIVVKGASVDAESDIHLFIEPDSNGNWRIARNIERIFGMASCPGDVDKISDVRIVKWAVYRDDDWKYRTGQRYLRLIDEEGEEMSLGSW